MKRIIIISVLSLFPMLMSAQSAMDSFFSRYNGEEGYQSIIYGKRMLEMMKNDASPDVKDLLDKIRVIRLVNSSKPENHFIDLARRELQRGKKHEIISLVNEADCTLEFYITDEDRKTKEVSFVMIICRPQVSAVMEIIGRFDVKDINRLSVIGQKQ